MLIAQHRRSRALGKASDAQSAIGDKSKIATFDRLKAKVPHEEAISRAKAETSAITLNTISQLSRNKTRSRNCCKKSKRAAPCSAVEEGLPVRFGVALLTQHLAIGYCPVQIRDRGPVRFLCWPL